jgi:hypothetical protein
MCVHMQCRCVTVQVWNTAIINNHGDYTNRQPEIMHNCGYIHTYQLIVVIITSIFRLTMKLCTLIYDLCIHMNMYVYVYSIGMQVYKCIIFEYVCLYVRAVHDYIYLKGKKTIGKFVPVLN